MMDTAVSAWGEQVCVTGRAMTATGKCLEKHIDEKVLQ